MALNHAPICECNECVTERRSPATGGTQPLSVEMNDPQLAKLVADADMADADRMAKLAVMGPFEPYSSQQSIGPLREYLPGKPLPWQTRLVGYVLIGTVAIPQPTDGVPPVQALLMRDPVSLDRIAIWWDPLTEEWDDWEMGIAG